MTDTSSRQKLRLSMAAVKTAKRNLRHLIDSGMTLREISKRLNGKVSYQVIGRFAKEKDYIPASEEIRDALGLLVPPNPYRAIPRWFKRTPATLEWWARKRGQIKAMFDTSRARDFRD